MYNMKTIRLFVLGFTLVSLFIIAGVALAVGPGPGNLCGASPNTSGANGLVVKKDVSCAQERTWSWNILKSADQTSLTLTEGQHFSVNYAVTASATPSDTNFQVSGTIYLLNTSSSSIVIESVSDSLGTVSCEFGFPYTLPAGWIKTCTYSGSLASAAGANVATVVDSAGVVVNATAPIDWSKAATSETDECADISDTYAGALGTVCAGQQTSFTFNYSRDISFDVCGQYKVENVASYLTNDSGASNSASWTVDVNVPCLGGCSLTPGYWKTHSMFGPAPYDSTWALVGENTSFFFSGQSYYNVLWTSPSGGNAYYILAHAYIAARLNQLSGADFSAAQAAFDQATALFSDPANTPAYVGSLKGARRNAWIDLATILDNYNNGLIGPGHCSE